MQKDDCGRKRRGNKGGIQNSCLRGRLFAQPKAQEVRVRLHSSLCGVGSEGGGCGVHFKMSNV